MRILFNFSIIFALLLLLSAKALPETGECIRKSFDYKDFSNKKLTGYNFVNANLDKANFTNADLTGADFTGAEVEEANFTNANLTGANFTNANLENANLTGAKIDNINFKNAELEYVIWIDGKTCAAGSIGSCW